MIKFFIRKRLTLQPEITKDTFITIFRDRVDKLFELKTFAVEEEAIQFEGLLYSSWESNKTTAKIQVSQEGNVLICQIEGENIPIMPWNSPFIVIIIYSIALVIAFFVGFFIPILISLIAYSLIGFALSWRKPEKYFNEILEALEFKHGITQENNKGK